MLAASFVAAAASGCVYLRLRELKHQLAEFDRHFQVRNDPQPTVVCLDPLFSPADVRKLLHLEPTGDKVAPRGREWIFYLEKEVAPGARHEEEFDLQIRMLFADERMSEVGLPLQYADFINMDKLRQMFQKVDAAQVDTDRRSAAWVAAIPREEISRLPDILKYLGPPTEVEEHPATKQLRYRYHLRGPAGLPEDGEADARVDLQVEQEQQRLLQTEVKIGKLAFHIDFAKKK